METDINIPKTKAVNFCFQNVKNNVYILICIKVARQSIQDFGSVSSTQGSEYLDLVYLGCFGLFIFNLIALFYVWCKIIFARTEFWIIYVLNLIWSLVQVGLCLEVISNNLRECVEIIMVQKCIILITLKKEFENIGVLLLPLEFSSRYSNIASNILFPYLVLTSGDLRSATSGAESQIIAIIISHVFVNFMALLLSLTICCFGRRGNKANAFKFFVLISAILFILVLIVIFSGAQAQITPSRPGIALKFIQNIYILINPIGIASMLLILCTLRNDKGDEIRDEILMQRNKMIDEQDYIVSVAQKTGINQTGIISVRQNQLNSDKAQDITKSYGTLFKK